MRNDIAEPDYWQQRWRGVTLPRRIHPDRDPLERRMVRLLLGSVPRGGRWLEVGCAASAWMPFFAERLGCEVWGVDYSTAGLDAARRNLELQRIPGRLLLGDFLEVSLPPASFRTVFSRGVIEHYRDPSPIFRRAAELLEPGGVKVTIVPNTSRVLGRIQRALDRGVLDVHVPFEPADLDRFQRAAGLEPVVAGRPFGVFALGVLNWESSFARLPRALGVLAAYAVQTLDRLVGWTTYPAESSLDNRWTSPYFVSVYRKPP